MDYLWFGSCFMLKARELTEIFLDFQFQIIYNMVEFKMGGLRIMGRVNYFGTSIIIFAVFASVYLAYQVF